MVEHWNFATDVIDRWAREHPAKHALVWVSETGAERRLTFAELREESLRAATFLTRTLGLARGDRVLLVLPRVPEFWFLVLGCIRAGIVFLPGTTMLTDKDLRQRIAASRARALVTDDPGRLPALAGTIPVVRYERPAEPQPAPDFPPTRADETMLIYFTSGTTGLPKMVPHTHASYGRGHEVTGRHWLDLGPADRHFTLSDTGWAKAAWGSIFGPWCVGATNVVFDFRGRFSAKALLEVVAREKVTTFCAPPTAWRALILEDLAQHDLTSVRRAVSAGEPLNPEVIETFKRATGLTIAEGYGQTETVVIVGMFPGIEPRPGSMGKPSPGFHVAVIDERGNELRGQEGDIAVKVRPERPVGLFPGYLDDDEANRTAFRGDWYVTGDRGLVDADGYFWFVGRADDVIKTSGYRVGPFEVESALLEHGSVAESAVIGVQDERLGQRIKAFVVLKPGLEGSAALAQELKDHVKRTTAPYKYPREVEFVLELPKTVSGKIRRAALRQR
jgi:acetyl-CoA synthetase